MGELAELIRKRGTCKGRLTIFERYLASFTDDVNCSEVQALEIKLRMSKIEENYSDFEDLQTRIESIVDEQEVEVQCTQRAEFENQYFANMAKAQQLSISFERNSPKKRSSGHNSSSSTSESGRDNDTVKNVIQGVKLPTIKIPNYSGEYGKWLEFRDTFVSLIHSNTSISNIQKFHYLRASLEGSAAQVISSLELSAANYHIGWNLLCERYDNTRLLVQNHVKAIFDEEPLKKESAGSIRKLLDSYTRNMRALETLGEPTNSWDTLIIYVISTKLDSRTLREWEEYKCTQKQHNLDFFTKFLKNRADLLETIEISTNKTQYTSNTQSNKTNKNIKSFSANTQPPTQSKIFKCPLCSNNHQLYICEKFLQMIVNDREQFVKNNKLCINCFRPGHNYRMCRLGPCKNCKRRHNTLLHKEEANETSDPSTPSITSASVSAHNHCGHVLLATAVIKIMDAKNKPHDVKAVLDSGSQASFMTESLMAKLGLKAERMHLSVAGINNAVSPITKRCTTIIQSNLDKSFQANVVFLVLPYITSSSNKILDVTTLKIPSQITLADPEFYNPSSIDLLLGADIFWDLLGSNQLRLGNNFPVLQETKFGYIVSGPIGKPSTQISCNFSQFEQIQEQLAKFWAIEETPELKQPVFSVEEKSCEKHFIENMKRTNDGRFSVSIPLKKDGKTLGDSFEKAKICFLSLERRLQRQSVLKAMYIDFMAEYIQLGHMTKGDIKNRPPNSYFLPHHGVLREQSSTTKLRVVFNGSAPTKSGPSLNDIQMVGPTIQSDLVSILLRFRQYRFVLAGDIEKMYRQVLINQEQRHLQQIIWRQDPSESLQTYTLNTVTYGTASAPFLAVRCLKQLANECNNDQVRQIINEDFYVDDLLTGHATAEGLMQIRTQVSQVLASGCFNLRKFRSNLSTCNSSEASDTAVSLSEHDQSNTLGLKWSPKEDKLRFDVKVPTDATVTKRLILSTISQIFDPLGLLSIFIITGKIILQKLWLHKLQWDDPVPSEVLRLWSTFVADLAHVNNLRIPRYVLCNNPIDIQLHVFSDASKDAYGACAYLRSEDSNGNVEVHLLCSKSRVASLKIRTIPRLELCGAWIAAKLFQIILNTTRLQIDKCFLWSDSSVVLGWLKTPPNRLKEFVKNRVADIQERTQNVLWRHVPTASNPADLLSRGVNLQQDDKLDIWGNGPKFLASDEDSWPNKKFDQFESELPEITSNVAMSNENTALFPFSRFSKLSKLRNTMAYVLRFIKNSKEPNKDARSFGLISHTERKTAHITLLKLSQRESFFKEYAILTDGKRLSNKNTLLSMSPFLDETGLLRVGGRIKNGNFSFEKTHPILLSSKHPLTRVIFEHEHLRLMHAGPQLLLSSIREEIWALGGRNLSKQIVRKCQRCFRLNAKTVTPIMGNLPEQRLQPGYPFQNTGMDYAGPITALNRRGRGSKTEKVYIAIFVCFATKCIHLELVSDLTSSSFLLTLRRFIARRSKPSTLFSDNGTQFVGARNELYKFITDNAVTIISNMSEEGINFKFIPAYAPHMAGLAEAGVKSVKSHLRRVLGNSHLVFEDLYTVLVQIEAILNSRPLTPLSADPHDLSPLTPGHFLVGRALTALPVPELKESSRLTRYERMEQMRQHFWVRWHKEYIAELQNRIKWRSSKGTLKEGALVLIKDDGLPPMKWSLGRIINLHPGTDGISRVADLRTSKGVIRRAFTKLCPLPAEDVPGLKDQPFNVAGHVANRTGLAAGSAAASLPATSQPHSSEQRALHCEITY